MDFSDYKKKQTEVSKGPHPDFHKNKTFFDMQMSRVAWKLHKIDDEYIPIVQYEFQTVGGGKKIFDPGSSSFVNSSSDLSAVIFVFPSGPKDNKSTFVISFHQDSRKNDKSPGFKEGLCYALNYLGSKKWLAHKDKNSDRTPRNRKIRTFDESKTKAEIDRDNEWATLFG